MPIKPTKPFGRIRFSKDGSVRREIFRLPDAKPEQERAAMSRFIELHNSTWPAPAIDDLAQLAEADNDFAAYVAGQPVVLELTEIVDRQFVDYMSPEDLKTEMAARLRHGDIELHRRGENAAIVNVRARDSILEETIRAKIAKSYSRPTGTQFWLVVFSVASLTLEVIRGGALHISTTLARARTDLRARGPGVFDVIWFSDLQTRPIRVWPVPVEELSIVLPDRL